MGVGIPKHLFKYPSTSWYGERKNLLCNLQLSEEQRINWNKMIHYPMHYSADLWNPSNSSITICRVVILVGPKTWKQEKGQELSSELINKNIFVATCKFRSEGYMIQIQSKKEVLDLAQIHMLYLKDPSCLRSKGYHGQSAVLLLGVKQ